MLDGIVMNIIHVPGIIGITSDLMFPKAPLPQASSRLLCRDADWLAGSRCRTAWETWRLSKLNRVE